MYPALARDWLNAGMTSQMAYTIDNDFDQFVDAALQEIDRENAQGNTDVAFRHVAIMTAMIAGAGQHYPSVLGSFSRWPSAIKNRLTPLAQNVGAAGISVTLGVSPSVALYFSI